MASQQTIARAVASGAIKIPAPPKAPKPLKAVRPARQTRPTPILKPGASQQQIAIATNGTGTPGGVNIIPVGNRGAYSTKGTPGGAPANPQPGRLYTQPNGTQWVYRPAGPNGPGWYTRPPATSTSSTTPPPAATTTPPAATTPPASGPTPGTPEWWSSMFAADPRLTNANYTLPSEQNQIGSSYGFYINRDAAGNALYRRPKKDESGAVVKDAQGNVVYDVTGITQTYDPQTGRMIYKDAAGMVYTPDQIEMDIQRVQRGSVGYLEGAMGSAEAQSANRQYEIGNQAAQAGVGKSGMRASGSAGEVAALQSALSGLNTRAGGELAGVDRKYADVYTAIYNDLVDKLADYVPPAAETGGDTSGDTGDNTGGGTGGWKPGDPPTQAAAPNNTNPQMPDGLPVGSALSGGPQGQFMSMINGFLGQREWTPAVVLRELKNMLNMYALTNQQKRYLNGLIATWEKRVNPGGNASGGGSGSSGSGGGSGGGASNRGTVGGIEPLGNRGAYTAKGTPGGTNVPGSPSAGQQYTGPGGVKWVYRTQGPNGAGWYKKP